MDGRTDDGVRVKRVNNDDANAHSVRRVRHANQRREEGGEQGATIELGAIDRDLTSNVASVLLYVPVISSHRGLFLFLSCVTGCLSLARKGLPLLARRTVSSPCTNTRGYRLLAAAAVLRVGK